MKQWLKWLFNRTVWPVVILFLVGCASEDQQDPIIENRTDEAVFKQTVEQLHIPWSITKSDEYFYISERNGSIVTVDIETGEMTRLPVQLQENLYAEGEGGFLGLELLPNMDGQAFAYHTYQQDGRVLNRVVRIEKVSDQWQEVDVVIDQIPGAGIHNGGRLKIGPDEMLYVTTGDAASPELAQSLDSLAGKILRLKRDGAIPEDNPFPYSPVFSYGHRNPQGLAWDENGRLYATEHGQSAHDEINLIEAGKNYGWPLIQGDEVLEGMETPLYHTNGNTWAPSGMAYHEGNLYIATLRGQAVQSLALESLTPDSVVEGEGRIRDVWIDGNTLYYITNNTDGRGTPAANDDRLLHIELK